MKTRTKEQDKESLHKDIAMQCSFNFSHIHDKEKCQLQQAWLDRQGRISHQLGRGKLITTPRQQREGKNMKSWYQRNISNLDTHLLTSLLLLLHSKSLIPSNNHHTKLNNSISSMVEYVSHPLSAPNQVKLSPERLVHSGQIERALMRDCASKQVQKYKIISI